MGGGDKPNYEQQEKDSVRKKLAVIWLVVLAVAIAEGVSYLRS